MRPTIALLLALVLFPATIRAQVSNLDGQRVANVAYDPPQQPIAAEDLKRLQQVTAGSPYSAKSVAETIDRLFATGAYADIQVDAERGPSGLAVTFRTKAAPFTGHVKVEGKILSPPSRVAIVSAAEFRLGAPFEEDALSSAEKNIQQLFTSNGLYDAQVHVEKSVEPGTEIENIIIQVRPGKRARYEMPKLEGDLKLPDSTIVSATGWRVILIHRWRGVTQSLTQRGVESVRKKYQKQDRLAADVELKSLDYDASTHRVKPDLQIDAGPRIRVKALETKVGKGTLKSLVPVYEEGAIDDDLLYEGARNLRDHFQDQGYPDVDVTFRVTPLENDQRTVEFIIARGSKKKLSAVAIVGNKYFDNATIRERIVLLPVSLRFRHGRYSEGFRKRDEETIAALYRANGFRDVKVASTVADNYKGKPGQIAVTYHIDEGGQWFIAKLELEGFDPADAAALGPRLTAAEGQPYSDVNAESDRNDIIDHYYRRGFPKATLQVTETPAEKPREVNLRYAIFAGPQEFVRDVRILGLTRTHRGLIEKHLTVHPGDPLSPVDIDLSRRALDDLGIFGRVDTAIEDSDGNETHKYVLYDIDEANRYTARFGIGAEIAQIGASSTTLSEPVGGTGFSPRFLLSVSRIDFLGLGHTITFDGRISNLEQRAGLSYTIPNFLESKRRTLTFSTLYDKASDVRTFTAKREEASVQLSQKLSKPSTLLVRFAYRRVSTSNIAIPDLLIPQLVQPVRIGIFSLNYAQDRRDNPANATRGMYNAIDVGVASSVFGSQRNFIRALGRNATYYRLFGKVVLARQTEFGLIKPFHLEAGLSSDDAVPLPERFFGGGNLTDRAFGENEAGPRDIGMSAGPGGTATQATGFPLGGNALLFNNTELRFPVIGDNIGAVIFHDMGNIYTNLSSVSFRYHQNNDQDFNYMVHAVGVGLRYRTPIGPLRADVAYALNPPRFVGFQGTIDQLLTCNPNLPASQLPAICTGVPQRLSGFQFFFSIGQTF